MASVARSLSAVMPFITYHIETQKFQSSVMNLRSTVLNKRVLGALVFFSLDGYTGSEVNDAIDYEAEVVGDNMLIKKYHDSFYIRHTEAFISSGSKRWLA